MKPLFSIIVPVYNVEQYLRTCIESVFSQTYKNWELILVDDGSSDSCPQICDEYGLNNNGVKVIHKKNGGLSDARNHGINTASGFYLLFIDSDDYWMDENFLFGLSEIIKDQPEIEIINFGWTRYFQNSNRFIVDKRRYSITKKDGESKSDYIKRMLGKDLFIASACNKCISRHFVTGNNLYFKKGVRSEDIEWCGQVLFQMPSMTCYNNNSYIYRQQRSDSITASVDTKHISHIVQMISFAINNSSNLPQTEKYMYLSFFAVQYLTLLYNINTRKLRGMPELHNNAMELKGILKYDINYKVKFAKLVLRLLGYNLTSKLLFHFVQFRRG